MEKPVQQVHPDTFRSFLITRGYCFRRMHDGHERWSHPGREAPVVLRKGDGLIPPFALVTMLRTMKVSQEEWLQFLHTPQQ